MIFTRNKKLAVNSFVLKLVNNSCPDLLRLQDGPRAEARVNLTVVVLVIPLEKKKLLVPQAFHATTKDFSSTSVGVMIHAPRTLDDAILGFRWEGEMYYALAKAKHLTPQGGGFHQLGFNLLEMVSPKDYPELRNLSF